MSVAVGTKGYMGGTHRACPPEETLARVAPHLPRAGVTRVADITGLDHVGIPVLCAIRPRGEILQTTNGKGLRRIDAHVSAAMEALEHWHCEQPPLAASLACEDGLTLSQVQERYGGVRKAVDPRRLPMALEATLAASPRMRWVSARDLGQERDVWLPAPAVHANEEPRAYTFSTNGLASGNTLDEATLHGLYEVVERDVVTGRVENGRLRLDAPNAQRVRLDSVDAPGAAALLERIRAAGLRVCLLHLTAPCGVTVLWAALLDPDPFHPCTRVSFGFGAHLSPSVAAVRALSEAAQARLAFIHGVREDMGQRIRVATESVVRPVFDFFDRIPESLGWDRLADHSTGRLDRDLDLLLDAVRREGFRSVWRADLTRPDLGIPVVKVIVPGALHDRRFF